jgi:uncharacterized protein (UPF0261 family)
MTIKTGSIVMLGCFDTKAEDFTYMLDCLKENGEDVICIDMGVMDTKVDFPIEFKNEEVAKLSGTPLQVIRNANDRGKAVELMGKGAAAILTNLVKDRTIKGVIGMGGGGGTYMTLAAMQEVPLGIPKICLSTIASWDLQEYVGVKDITLMSSVVDVAGLNSISRLLIKQASAAICSMSNVEVSATDCDKKTIAISMFGNTTKCVDKCSKLLKAEGFEVMVFHATGVGGSTMESLIREGVFDAVMDVTTTELADEYCGGILSAGPDRLTAARDMSIPQVVVPGCLDMVNFGHRGTMPDKYNDRHLYSWAPNVTLMRTNVEENTALGKLLADKLNSSTSPVTVMIPQKGISQVDAEGEIFHGPAENKALFDSIKNNAVSSIPVIEVDAHINDEAFSIALVKQLLKIIETNIES